MLVLNNRVPRKKYPLLCLLLFAGWVFTPSRANQRKTILAFSHASGWLCILDEFRVRLISPQGDEHSRGYRFVKTHFKTPGILLDLTKEFEAFDLSLPEKGLQPAVEIHKNTIFRSLVSLLNKFVGDYKREPLKVELKWWIYKHRKGYNLTGNFSYITRYLRLGNGIFWTFEKVNVGRAVKVRVIKDKNQCTCSRRATSSFVNG
jgi:hypothetical protein